MVFISVLAPKLRSVLSVSTCDLVLIERIGLLWNKLETLTAGLLGIYLIFFDVDSRFY